MRPEKNAIMKEIISRLEAADFAFVLNYGGLTVSNLSELRATLKPLNSRAMVVKNTMLDKAVKTLGWKDISSILTGPTAMVTGAGEVTEVAKALVGFVKKYDKASIKGASVETAALSAADVAALSKLPSKDAMRGMLLGTFLAPATQFVRVLNAPLTNVLYVLKAYEEKKTGSAA